MREHVRRGVTLVLLTIALASWPDVGWRLAAIVIVCGAAIYILLPVKPRPQGAMTYERLPAVIGPDLLGLGLTSVFAALPFWARMGEPYLWEDFGLLVHPSAFLAWPLALISATILWFSARYAAFWLVIEPEGLRIGQNSGERFILFSEIISIDPFRRGLPGWLRWLAPLMVIAGKTSAAGALLLARDTTGISLILRDGSSVDIAQEAFEKPLRRVLNALKKNHVSFGPQLALATEKPRG